MTPPGRPSTSDGEGPSPTGALMALHSGPMDMDPTGGADMDMADVGMEDTVARDHPTTTTWLMKMRWPSKMIPTGRPSTSDGEGPTPTGAPMALDSGPMDMDLTDLDFFEWGQKKYLPNLPIHFC